MAALEMDSETNGGVAPAELYAALARQHEELHSSYASLSVQHTRLAEQYAAVCQTRDELQRRLDEFEGQEVDGDDEAMGAEEAADSSDETARERRRAKKSRILKIDQIPQITPEDFILFEITFPDEVMQLLDQLFGELDTQKQGWITESSFTTGVGQQFIQNFGIWEDIKSFFDEDNNNAIDPQEFVKGFARLALEKSVTAENMSMSLGQFYDHMQQLVKQFATEEIVSKRNLLKDINVSKAPESMPRTQSNIIPDHVVYRAVIHDSIKEDMGHIWTTLLGKQSPGEADDNESITMASFQNAGCSLGDWERILQLFDADNSGTIEQKEFLDGFKQWLLQDPIQIQFPNSQSLLKEILLMVDQKVNENLSNALVQFKSSL